MNEANARYILTRYEEALAAHDVLRAEYDAARHAPYIAIAPAVEALQAQIDALQNQIEELQESVLPDVLAIETQYADRLNGMDIAVSAAEANVRIAVLAVAKSVKGAHLHAVYTRGSETWDAKGLAGYAVAYPEVLKFRTVGKPSVSIRTAK